MGEFIRMLMCYRFLWVAGRFGGGKTTLSLKLADGLVGRRWTQMHYTACNFPLNVDAPYTVTTDLRDIQSMRDVVMLLDEAGQFLELGANTRRLKEWFSYLRKMNQVVIMASVLPVAKFASQFRIQRVFNGLGLGIPLWLYRWHLGVGDTREDGKLLWWNPAEVWGLFDTDYQPDDRWFIYDWTHGETGDGDGDGDESEASQQLGIESFSPADVDVGGVDSGGRVGGQCGVELSGRRTGTQVSSATGDGYGNGDGSDYASGHSYGSDSGGGFAGGNGGGFNGGSSG